MKSRKLFRLMVLALLAAACQWSLSGVWSSGSARAEEPAAGAEDKDQQSKADRFKIPDGDANKIQAFMHKLREVEAEGESEAEQAEFATKVLTTMSTAADRLLAAKPTTDQAREAYNFKFMALQLLSQLGDETAEEQLVKAIDAARADKRREVVGIGWQTAIQLKANQWDALEAKDRQAFQEEVLAEVTQGEPEAIDVSIVRAVADGLEHVDDAFVVDLVKKSLPTFKQSKNGKVKEAFAQSNLEGMMRRLNLLGNQMEISGTLLNGKPVDWNSYRGKVVLVDFWATWCGPCRAEVPNVLEMYAGYHDKGFEVLGVSLDQTPEDAHKYVQEMKIPWQSIFPKNEKQRVWDNPLVKYYDIVGIPTAILVGQDGKVVHLEARGEVLREELKQLLGDPIEVKEAKAPATEPASN